MWAHVVGAEWAREREGGAGEGTGMVFLSGLCLRGHGEDLGFYPGRGEPWEGGEKPTYI